MQQNNESNAICDLRLEGGPARFRAHMSLVIRVLVGREEKLVPVLVTIIVINDHSS